MLKAERNKWVLSSDLNSVGSVVFWMCLGREFQRVGAAKEKALSPHVLCLVLGTVRTGERHQRSGGYVEGCMGGEGPRGRRGPGYGVLYG